jgi:hypothetical protein
MLGTDRPFAICARRPSDADPQRWAHFDGAPHHGGVPRYENGLEALAAVSGGTLCVGRQRPRDFRHVLEAHRDPSSRVQLVVCARALQHDLLIAPLAIAPLAERRHELDRIIDGYAADVATAPGSALQPSDRAWIRSAESDTLARLETATVRVALARAHGVTEAAEILHMSHGSLSEWFARRSIDIDDGGR